LIERAQHGDQKAMVTIRGLLRDVPELEKAILGVDRSFDPGTYARLAMLAAALDKKELLTCEMWARRAAALERELAGPNVTALERNLCQRVATCWLDVQLADLIYASSQQTSMSYTASEYFQRRQDRANARYLAAVMALARVRRLLAPIAQQVNIAQPGAQQLNVAQPGILQENIATAPQQHRRARWQ